MIFLHSSWEFHKSISIADNHSDLGRGQLEKKKKFSISQQLK